MEQAVCDVCKDIRIGKILIQTNRSTGEPEVCNLKNYFVICSIICITNSCLNLALLFALTKRY